MNMVIATGCPNSGWEMALPVLQRAGLEPAGASVNHWLDEYFQASETGDALQTHQSLQTESSLSMRVAALFPANVHGPVLLADSRYIGLLDFWAKQFPQAQFLLFFTRAESALAHALQQGVEFLPFMEQWQASNRQLLIFHRRYRQRTLLLDAESATLHPQALEAVCRRIGLVLKPTANFSTPAIALSSMERLLAEYLLAKQPEVKLLQMELEASSQPLGDIAPKLELQPAGLIDSFRQNQSQQRTLQQQLEQAQEALQKQEATHRETAQENELLLQQLHQVQEELEASLLLKLQIEQTLKLQIEQTLKQHAAEQQELSNQLEQAQQALQIQEVANKAMAQENELLLLQQHQVQAELEYYFNKNRELADGVTRELQAGDKVSGRLSWNRATQLIARLFKTSRKERKRIEKQVAGLKTSGLFDEIWYLSTYPDVARAGIDPVKHYLYYGAAEERNPSPEFDTRYYLASNPDVATKGINPLVHYAEFGKAEGRRPYNAESAA